MYAHPAPPYWSWPAASLDVLLAMAAAAAGPTHLPIAVAARSHGSQLLAPPPGMVLVWNMRPGTSASALYAAATLCPRATPAGVRWLACGWSLAVRLVPCGIARLSAMAAAMFSSSSLESPQRTLAAASAAGVARNIWMPTLARLACSAPLHDMISSAAAARCASVLLMTMTHGPCFRPSLI